MNIMKDKLIKYLEQVYDATVKYRDDLNKQIEVNKEEIEKMEQALNTLNSRVEELKQMLEYVKKLK